MREMLMAVAIALLCGCTPAVRPGTAVQAYAVRHERLHPAACDFLREFGVVERPETIHVLIRPRTWPPFTLSGREYGPTPAFVLGETMYFAEHVLNYPGRYLGNTFDLATPEGAAVFAHDAFHVEQLRQNGWGWLLWQYARTVLMSWQQKREFWSHELSEFEQAAMALEREVRDELSGDTGQLAVFAELQRTQEASR